jgi:hypothetical protein
MKCTGKKIVYVVIIRGVGVRHYMGGLLVVFRAC